MTESLLAGSRCNTQTKEWPDIIGGRFAQRNKLAVFEKTIANVVLSQPRNIRDELDSRWRLALGEIKSRLEKCTLAVDGCLGGTLRLPLELIRLDVGGLQIGCAAFAKPGPQMKGDSGLGKITIRPLFNWCRLRGTRQRS